MVFNEDYTPTPDEIQKALADLSSPEVVDDESGKKEPVVQKSLPDQIKEAQETLKALENKEEEIQKSIADTNKGDNINPPSVPLKEFSDEIMKSFGNVETKINSMAKLVVNYHKEQQELKGENEELKKSLTENGEKLEKAIGMIDQIGNFTPGIRSLKNKHVIEKSFADQGSEGGKPHMSVTRDKLKLQSYIEKAIDNEDWRKKNGKYISLFDAGTVAPEFRKSLEDELNVTLVQ